MSFVGFRVSTRATDRLRTVQVRVYDTGDELRSAGRAYWAREWPANIEDVTDRTVGLSQSFEKFTFDGDDEVRHPEAGFLRFSKPYIGAGIVSHECAHMALSIFHQDVTSKAIDDAETEEKFCYLLGDLVRKVIDGMYRHGVY